MTIRAVRGVRDILPGEAAKWQRVEDTARRTFEAYGIEDRGRTSGPR
jgi:histidyl-tRNA synthetase